MRFLARLPSSSSAAMPTARSFSCSPAVSVMAAFALAAVSSSGCTPASSNYELHTAGINCDEAGRAVYATIIDMGMTVTAFEKPGIGRPGVLQAHKDSSRGPTRGSVGIRCDEDGTVHIDPKQEGVVGERNFERGVFLGVSGRTGLVVERGVITGRRTGGAETQQLERVSRAGAGVAASSAGVSARSIPGKVPAGEELTEAQVRAGAAAASNQAAASTGITAAATSKISRSVSSRVTVSRAAAIPSGSVARNAVRVESAGVGVELEPLYGFATVLDFDADLGAAGILPVRVVVRNAGKRTIAFDPDDITIRVRGARDRAPHWSADETVAQLQRAAAGRPEIGDVAAAARAIRSRVIRSETLAPSQSVEGFLYLPAGDYDRATVRMTDRATGETEGFRIELPSAP